MFIIVTWWEGRGLKNLVFDGEKTDTRYFTSRETEIYPQRYILYMGGIDMEYKGREIK